MTYRRAWQAVALVQEKKWYLLCIRTSNCRICPYLNRDTLRVKVSPASSELAPNTVLLPG